MQRSLKFGMVAVTACLLSTASNAQNPINGLSPADTRPSLVAPPSSAPLAGNVTNGQTYDSQGDDYRPIESYPPAYQGSPNSSTIISRQPVTGCESGSYATTTSRPIVTLSPVTLPPAAYSRTYVPPPPYRARYATPVSYNRPVVYSQTVPATVVSQRPVAPVVVATPQYYLPPVVPVQPLPAGATIGRGVLGQPTVYVPGQPVRNVLRYLSP